MFFRARNLKYWELGPCGISLGREAERAPLGMATQPGPVRLGCCQGSYFIQLPQI